MTKPRQCEFFLLRYVPDAVKNEFVNIGVVLLESGSGFAEARFASDWQRVRCLDPDADLEMLAALQESVQAQLSSTQDRERLLRVMNESFSSLIQVSAPSACETESPAHEIGQLAQMYVETAHAVHGRQVSGRQRIYSQMREAFEGAGVWSLMRRRIPVADYTHKGDPLKLDCGYRPNGVVRFFHAVSLSNDMDTAKILAFSFPQIARGFAEREQMKAELTAVVEDGLDRGDDATSFALAMLERSRINVARQSELPRLADRARQELQA